MVTKLKRQQAVFRCRFKAGCSFIQDFVGIAVVLTDTVGCSKYHPVEYNSTPPQPNEYMHVVHRRCCLPPPEVINIPVIRTFEILRQIAAAARPLICYVVVVCQCFHLLTDTVQLSDSLYLHAQNVMLTPTGIINRGCSFISRCCAREMSHSESAA